MYGVKRSIIILFVLISLILFLAILISFKFSYHPEYFSKEELEDYSSPIVFLKSVDNEKRYFIKSDEPDNKCFLEYSEIWDYDANSGTFLFSMVEDEKERIYEYDLQNESYQCLFDESFISQYLQIPDEEEFESVYYHLSNNEVSGVYGDILFIYNKMNSQCTYTMHLPDVTWREVYGWLDANTFLFRDYDKTFLFNTKTEEMINTGNYLGTSIYISPDKTVGCSARDENWFGGVIFTPILFWDTTDYNIKKLHEGFNSSAHLQMSDDHKYILFERSHTDENDQLLCIRIEDEKLCVYFETEEKIVDLLW